MKLCLSIVFCSLIASEVIAEKECDHILCDESGCTGYGIADCRSYTCRGSFACSGFSIANAKEIICDGKFSCSGLVVDGFDKMTCSGGDGDFGACTDGLINSNRDSLLVCDGPSACNDINVSGDSVSVYCTKGGCVNGKQSMLSSSFDVKCLICEDGEESCDLEFTYMGELLSTTLQASTTTRFGSCRTEPCKFCNQFPDLYMDADLDDHNDCLDQDADGTIDACEAGFGAVKGDPHIIRWNEEPFDFHGECDLVLLHSDHVNNGKNLDLHIRTTLDGSYSSIEQAALQVGDELIEFDAHKFYYKGKEYADKDLPLKTTEFTVSAPVNIPGLKVRKDFTISLNDNSVIMVRRSKNYLSISVNGHYHDFDDSYGLLGDFFTGDPVGRDGRLIQDWVEYGMEWQVLPDEPKLFRENRPPQLPHASCQMPTEAAASKLRRLLRRSDSAMLYELAETACADAGPDLSDCINNLLLTAAAEAF